jgi:hypothetical protein
MKLVMTTPNQFIAFHAILSYFGHHIVKSFICDNYDEHTFIPQIILQQILNTNPKSWGYDFIKFYCDSWGIECDVSFNYNSNPDSDVDV